MSFAQVISEAYVTFHPATNVNAKYTLNMLKVRADPRELIWITGG